MSIMTYESYTETLFHIQKKNDDDSILTLKKFTNNTREIGTTLKPMSWYECYDEGIQGNKLIDTETGEIIAKWDKQNITYISNEYQVLMEQHHTAVSDEHRCRLHNDYIKYTI